MSERLVSEVFRQAVESLDAGPPPYAAVVARARARRTRGRRRVVAGVAAVAVVVAGASWLVGRGSDAPADLPPADVRRAPNPVDVVWYAAGVLHLQRVTVELPDLTAVVELPGGAVYADGSGDVAFVGADGGRRRIGHKDAVSALVGSIGDGWAAWIDPEGGGTGRPALMVYDVSRDALLAPRDVAPAGVTLIGIDQQRVYLSDAEGTSTWDPVAAVTSQVDRDGLVDVESATRVYQVGRRIDMVQPFFSVHFVRPGVGAQLSAGGLYAISRPPRLLVSYPDGSFRPLLYDVRSGDRLPTGLTARERAVDATFGDNAAVVYLVTEGTGQPVVLRRCTLREHGCKDLAVVRPGAGPALLAH